MRTHVMLARHSARRIQAAITANFPISENCDDSMMVTITSKVRPQDAHYTKACVCWPFGACKIKKRVVVLRTCVCFSVPTFEGYARAYGRCGLPSSK